MSQEVPKPIKEKMAKLIRSSLCRGRANPMEIEAWAGDFFDMKYLPFIRQRLKEMEKQNLVTHKVESVTVPPYYAIIGEKRKVLARKRSMSVYYPTEKYICTIKEVPEELK